MKKQLGYRYLLKNIGILTLSCFATKLLSIFLVPIYTTVLSTTDYGEYDLLSSTVGLLVPILTINIYEAVLRYSMDNESKKSVFSIGCKYCLIGNAVVAIFLVINHLYKINEVIDEYFLFFFLMFFINSVSGILSAMAKGMEKIKEISIASVIGSTVTITLNIVMLCIVKLEIVGYFLANIIGMVFQAVMLFVYIRGWNYITFKGIETRLNQAMVHYSLPTIANAIAWWVNGLADRYFIIWFCGISMNGIYSVASKIPSIINIFQNIFSQAFILSAVKELDKNDRYGFFRRTYSLYNFVLVIVCSFIIMFDKVLAHYLYSNEFYDTWRFVPFLTISIIFGSLSGYAGSIFAALKHPEYFVRCSGSGAIANVCMNFIIVPLWGALGAAVSTTISYWIVYFVSMYYLKKSMNIKLNLTRDNVAYGLLMIQSIVLLNERISITLQYGIQVVIVLCLFILYTSEIKAIFTKAIINRSK